MSTAEGSAKGAKRVKGPKPKNVRIEPDDAADETRPVVLDILENVLPDLPARKRETLADLCLKAACESTTITDACRSSAKGPSARTARRHLGAIDLDTLEDVVRDKLWEQVPRHVSRRVTVAIDWTEIPYHGEHCEDESELKRSKARDGTTWFHTYATLYLCIRNKRYTFSLRFVRKKDTPTRILELFLEEMKARGLRPRLVLADRAFCTVKAVRLFRDRELAFITPLPLRGKRAKALCGGRGARWESYELGKEPVRVAVVVKRNGDKYHGKRKGNVYFPYVAHGLDVDPKRVDRLYRQRVGIETSYRLMNQARARTSSRRPAVRLFHVALSFVLQNAWVTLCWLVSAPKRGHTGRHRPKGHFPFKAYLRLVRAWVTKLYGAVLVIKGLPRWRSSS